MAKTLVALARPNSYSFVRWWKRHSFKLLVGISILLLLLMICGNDWTAGTWSERLDYDPADIGLPFEMDHHKPLHPELAWKGEKGWTMTPLSGVAPPSKPPKISAGEQACRAFLETRFQRPFPTVRPDFLRNPITGHNLEIDCYNEELKLGAEYDGIQHRKFVKGMHRSMEDFRNGQYRDLIKDQLCAQNGVTLIRVPDTVPIEGIPEYLSLKLKELGKLY